MMFWRTRVGLGIYCTLVLIYSVFNHWSLFEEMFPQMPSPSLLQLVYIVLHDDIIIRYIFLLPLVIAILQTFYLYRNVSIRVRIKQIQLLKIVGIQGLLTASVALISLWIAATIAAMWIPFEYGFTTTDVLTNGDNNPALQNIATHATPTGITVHMGLMLLGFAALAVLTFSVLGLVNHGTVLLAFLPIYFSISLEYCGYDHPALAFFAPAFTHVSLIPSLIFLGVLASVAATCVVLVIDYPQVLQRLFSLQDSRSSLVIYAIYIGMLVMYAIVIMAIQEVLPSTAYPASLFAFFSLGSFLQLPGLAFLLFLAAGIALLFKDFDQYFGYVETQLTLRGAGDLTTLRKIQTTLLLSIAGLSMWIGILIGIVTQTTDLATLAQLAGNLGIWTASFMLMFWVYSTGLFLGVRVGVTTPVLVIAVYAVTIGAHLAWPLALLPHSFTSETTIVGNLGTTIGWFTVGFLLHIAIKVHAHYQPLSQRLEQL